MCPRCAVEVFEDCLLLLGEGALCIAHSITPDFILTIPACVHLQNVPCFKFPWFCSFTILETNEMQHSWLTLQGWYSARQTVPTYFRSLFQSCLSLCWSCSSVLSFPLYHLTACLKDNSTGKLIGRNKGMYMAYLKIKDRPNELFGAGHVFYPSSETQGQSVGAKRSNLGKNRSGESFQEGRKKPLAWETSFSNFNGSENTG